MSLLMNALKKAESAKQQSGANTAAVDGTAPAVNPKRDLKNELGLDDTPYRAPAKADSFDAETSLPSSGLSLEPSGLPTPPPSPRVASTGATMPKGTNPSKPPSSSGSAARTGDGGAAARNVFTAKQPKSKSPFSSDSKVPFYALVGGGLLAVAGYGGYLWIQITSPAPPPRAAVTPAPAPTPIPPAGAPIRQPDDAPIETARTSLPDSPIPTGPGATPSPVAAPTDSRVPMSPSTTAYPDGADPRSVGRGETNPVLTPTREARSRDVATASGGVGVERPRNLTVTRTETPAAVQPDIAAGYAALQAGDLDRAAQAYERAVHADPTSRDALLGAGTLQMRLNRPDLAEGMFRQALRHHPQDTFAAAQLAALTGAADPVGTLSQVNTLIARESGRQDGAQDNGALQFMQGNQFAVQGRWPEAQQAYFNAHRADPNNADYCFNLAVSLDRIREVRLARDYYAKALELARTRSAGFDQVKAQARLKQLNDTSR